MNTEKTFAQAIEQIWNHIYFIRGERAMLDFSFQLTNQEVINLRSQIATSSSEHRGRRFLPWAFTEHGVAVLAGVLNSPQAVHVNILVVREFIRMRMVLNSNEKFEKRILDLENNCDTNFSMAFESIRELMKEKTLPRKRIKGLAGVNLLLTFFLKAIKWLAR